MKINRKYILRGILAIILTPIILVLVVGIALYIPAVQDMAVRYASREASSALGMQIEIGRLRLGFPLKLRLERLHVVQAPPDTLLSLGELSLGLDLMPLLSKQVYAPSILARDIRLNYVDSASTTQLTLDELTGQSLSVDIDAQRVHLELLRSQGARVRYQSLDTLTKEEESEPIKWQIQADLLELLETSAQIDMPLDSMIVGTEVQRLRLEDTQVNLETMRLSLGHGQIEGGLVSYAKDYNAPSTDYLDYNHIQAEDIALEVHDLLSEGQLLQMKLSGGQLRERSGLALEQLLGSIAMDSVKVELTDLALRTSNSSFFGNLSMPWSMLSGDSTAHTELHLDCSIGSEDVRSLTGQSLVAYDEFASYDRGLKQADLTNPIDLGVHISGTLNHLRVDQMQMLWPDVLDLSVEGEIFGLTNDKERRGKLKIEGGLQRKARSLLALVSPDIAKTYTLPAGLTLKGNLDMGRGRHQLNLALKQGDGAAKLSGLFVEQSKQYQADLEVRALDLKRFMPSGSLGLLSADLSVEGRGFNPMNRHSHSGLKLRLYHLQQDSLSLEQITLDGNLNEGALALSLNSFNPGLNLALQADALLTGPTIYGSIMLDAQELDMKAWQMTESPLDAKFRLTGELRTNLKDEYQITSLVEDLSLNLSGRVLNPKEVLLQALIKGNHSEASVTSGDLSLQASAETGLDGLTNLGTQLGSKIDKLMAEVHSTRPMQTRLEDILPLLPQLSIEMNMGTDNALKDFLAEQRIALGSLSSQIVHDREQGLNGYLRLSDLRQDTLRLNALDLSLKTLRSPRTSDARPISNSYKKGILPTPLDSMTLELMASIDKKPYRAQEGFVITTKLLATLQRANLDLEWLDTQKRSRHRANVLFGWDGSHYFAHLLSSPLRIGYQDFEVSPRNHIALNKQTYFLRSDLNLRGKDRALISLQASDSVANIQDIHLIVQSLRLEDFGGLGLDNIGGTVFADVRYSRSGDINQEPIISGDISAQGLRYEDKELGHFATALFYEPRNNSSHYITAEVSYRGTPALSIDGIYHPDNERAPLSGNLTMMDFPLEMVNPFLTPYSTALAGSVSGSLSLSGEITSPQIQGAIAAKDGRVDLKQLATQIQLDSIPLRLEGSTLYFDHYALRSAVDSKRPLYIDGSIVAFGKEATKTDLRLRADEMVLLNQSSPRSEEQLVYGRLIASSDMRITGLADALKVRGNLSVLGGTNCTYIMREGPLEMGDKIGELVTFVDFSDTLFVKAPVETTRLGGLDVNLSLHFDPSVRFGVDLTADGRDYMRVQGGGDMQFSYPPFGQMSLIGRYEMSGGGKLHYTMPIVGGKLFNIDPSGYLLFNGDVANPYINFVATQTVRASTGEGKNAQKTNFVVSIKAQDHIDNIQLAFDLSAPENLSIQNSLSTMTAEERGKQAIGLLGTGIYLAGSRGGGDFNLDGALTSFLQSQINRAAGTLLQGTDLNIGMEVHDGANGGNAYTDYTYSFSRRFYNDRIRIVVGGKIQSGNVPSNKEQTLIDNVALEYQLDQAGDQYLRLFHKRVTDNILEGEYTETGGGYLLKRKLNHPWDLFRFRRRKSADEASLDTIAPSIWRVPSSEAKTDTVQTTK
ncbi:MAG: translocation/assembly module TamB domain-containing protein [Porphyromonadaceae bacterium]|nr:translocation/assembly module TamB domain-containing protein [Porphyromonadaceae bacterium]